VSAVGSSEATAARGRCALVQGASRGIGLEFVRQLLERGCAQVVATCRRPQESDGLRVLAQGAGGRLRVLPLDVRDEKSIRDAAGLTRETCERLHLLVNAAGVLHAADGLQPEKRLESVEPDALRRVFEVNAFGPLLVARHFLPLLRHDERAVLVNLSARVGSIADNRSGGWYAYRASKAAQNMFTKNLAIELARRAPNCLCVALHPGTVDTELSQPFRRNVPGEKLFDVQRAVRQLLAIAGSLRPEESGSFLAWDREVIPW
jgi:NAD(P)-dependent dehydrogenase (short-subunit alcohol dehydrogenase family)